MKRILRYIIPLMILALAIPAVAQTKDDPNCYFAWDGEKCTNTNEINSGVYGGTIQLSNNNIFTTKAVGNNDYKVIKLDELISAHSRYFTVKLDNPIESGDTLYVKGFWYFDANTSDAEYGIRPLTISLKDKEYQLEDFSNLLSQPDANPGYSRIILDGSVAGEKEITFEVKGTKSTLYIMEVSLCHNPNALKFLSVSPAPGSHLDAFESDESSNIVVTTNVSVNDILMTIHDEYTGTDILPQSALTHEGEKTGESGSVFVYSYAFKEPILLYEGHTYVVTFKAFGDSGPIGDDYILEYYGNLPEPFSTVKFTTQSPASDETITSAENNVITLGFSGSAKIEKVEALYGEAKTKDCTFAPAQFSDSEWLVTVPEEIINDNLGFNLHIYAVDDKGRKIITNEDTLYSIAHFICNVPKRIVIDPTGEEELDELSQFTLSYPGGIKRASEELNITLEKDGTEFLGSLKEDGDKFIYTLNSPITKWGQYKLTVPEGMFHLGVGFNNQEMEVEYTVKKKEYDAEIAWDGSFDTEAQQFTNLTGFTIDFTKGKYVAGYCDKTTLRKYPIELKKNGEVVAKVSEVNAIEGKAAFNCVFDKEIYIAGDYTLNIPANIFVLAIDINNLTYLLNEEMDFEVKVIQNENPEVLFGKRTITPPNGSAVKSLSRVVIRFEEAFTTSVIDETQPPYPVVKIKGEEEEATDYVAMLTKYTVGGQNMDGRLNISLVFGTENNGVFTPATIAAEGKYQTTVPSGSLLVKYTDGRSLVYDRDWVFTYTVTDNAGIDPIFAPVNPDELDPDTIVKVYNLQGIMVRQGRLDEVLNGLQGLFIVNGHKMLLK